MVSRKADRSDSWKSFRILAGSARIHASRTLSRKWGNVYARGKQFLTGPGIKGETAGRGVPEVARPAMFEVDLFRRANDAECHSASFQNNN